MIYDTELSKNHADGQYLLSMTCDGCLRAPRLTLGQLLVQAGHVVAGSGFGFFFLGVPVFGHIVILQDLSTY